MGNTFNQSGAAPLMMTLFVNALIACLKGLPELKGYKSSLLQNPKNTSAVTYPHGIHKPRPGRQYSSPQGLCLEESNPLLCLSD